MQIQTLVDTNEPATSVQSISWSVRQKVCFLGRPVGDFGVSDDDRMISTADPWCWRRSTDIMPQKSKLEKITGAKHHKKGKVQKKVGFRAKSGDLDPMVAGDHGAFVPFWSPFDRVFQSFSLLFSSIFFLIFLPINWLDFPEENLSRSKANQSTKFLTFWKSRRLSSRFSAKSWN